MKKFYSISLIIVLMLPGIAYCIGLLIHTMGESSNSLINSVLWYYIEIFVGVVAISNLVSYITSWCNMRWRFSIGKVIYVILNTIVIAFQTYICGIMTIVFWA